MLDNTIKLVALDLDGTLLNSYKQIPVSTVNYIKLISKYGIKVILASSRMLHSILPIYKILALDTPVIMLGGSYVINPKTKEVIYNSPMPRLDYNYLINQLEDDSIYFKVYSKNFFYTRCLDEQTKKFSLNYNSPGKAMNEKSLLEIPEAPYNLFALNIGRELRDKYYHKTKKYCQGLQLFSEGATGIGWVGAAAGKENALMSVCEHYKFSWENTLAIGNDNNDLKMIKAAGIGLAMGNACNKLKENAAEVLADNDNLGVEKALKKYLNFQ